jgi:hypothetical protein
MKVGTCDHVFDPPLTGRQIRRFLARGGIRLDRNVILRYDTP